MQVTRRSRLTGVLHTQEIDITPEQLTRWQAGEFIRDVAQNLTPDEREFIISGITAAEWDAAFSKGA